MVDIITRNILIAEKDSDVRAVYRTWLESEGYNVLVEFDNGKEGFRNCNRNRYDLVITSVALNDWDGIDFIAANSCVNMEQKILVVDYLTDEAIGELMELPNVVGWLQKPVTREEFLRGVRTSIG